MTTTEVRKLLRERHASDPGNGPAWAYLEEVRDEASFDGKRTIDAIGLGLWKSRGYEMHGYEIKISRGDLLKELKNPAKADPFFCRCDRFWLVCAPGICKVEEVPAAWGLMVPSTSGDRLRVAKMAPLNKQANRQVDRSFLVCLLRAAGAGLKHTPERAFWEEAKQLGYESGYAAGERSVGGWKSRYEMTEKESQELRAWKAAFLETFGTDLWSWRHKPEERRNQVFEALRCILGEEDAVARAREGVNRSVSQLVHAAEHLLSQAKWLRENVGAK